MLPFRPALKMLLLVKFCVTSVPVIVPDPEPVICPMCGLPGGARIARRPVHRGQEQRLRLVDASLGGGDLRARRGDLRLVRLRFLGRHVEGDHTHLQKQDKKDSAHYSYLRAWIGSSCDALRAG